MPKVRHVVFWGQKKNEECEYLFFLGKRNVNLPKNEAGFMKKENLAQNLIV